MLTVVCINDHFLIMSTIWACLQVTMSCNKRIQYIQNAISLFLGFVVFCCGLVPVGLSIPFRAISLARNTLKWRHDGHDGVSNHQPHDCLLSRLFRCRSKKTSKLRVTGLCEGNSPASNAENVSIWLRHHELYYFPVPVKRPWNIVLNASHGLPWAI